MRQQHETMLLLPFSLNAKIPCAFVLEDLPQQIAAGF
jgi:hypothetical protein